MSKPKIYILFIIYIVAEIIILVIDIAVYNIFTGILITVISLINLSALLFYRFVSEIKNFKVLLIYLANLITLFYFDFAYEVSYFNTNSIHYIAIGIAIGTLCCFIEIKILKHKINLKNFIVTIICSGFLLCSILSFVNVRLDFSDKKIITVTVTDKSASSLHLLYNLEITAKSDKYKELTFGVDLKKSKETTIGDSIDITCRKGVFGEEYYYYDNFRFKDFYYDFWSFLGIQYEDCDDEFFAYINSIDKDYVG